MASTGGYGFVSKIGDMLSNRKAGREFMSVREEDAPLEPVVFELARGNLLVTVSSGGKMNAFDLDDVGYLAKGRGVLLMGLDKGEQLVGVAVTREKRVEVTGTGRGGKENTIEIKGAEFTHYVSKRALKGRVLPDKVKKDTKVTS
jgi:topoisomerase-4 subunit A